MARIYYGTDTHAQGLLVGAALACALHTWAQRRRSWSPLEGGRARTTLAATGNAAVSACLVIARGSTRAPTRSPHEGG